MRLQKRYQFALAALAVIGLIVFLSWPPGEPVVKGKPLGEWLDQIHSDDLGDYSHALRSVVPEMDDHCIPWLTDQLNWQPSPVLRKAEGLSWEWFHHYLRAEPKDRRTEAALVLASLGPRAKSAIPALENLSRLRGTDSETESAHRGAAIAALILIRHDSMDALARKSLDLLQTNRDDCLFAICYLGTNAAPCLPVFTDAINTTTNRKVRFLAAQTLGFIHCRPDLSLPPLVSLLKDTNASTRLATTLALMRFGSSAKPAWNDLVTSLNDADQNVRTCVTDALTQIDPEAAQKLGIGAPPIP